MEYHTKKLNSSRNYKNIIYLKKLIFPPIDDQKIQQLMIDDESIKYITFNTSAQEITNIIMNSLIDFPCPQTFGPTKWNEKALDRKMKHLVVTEMTAGVGGNVINFSKYFKYVNAIEIDFLRYNYLNKNIKLYGYDNVNCYNQDSLEMLIEKDDLVQDIIFFDPPWGGKDYKLHLNLRITFGQYSIEDVCRRLFQRACNKMIVLKLPNNYDFQFLMAELKDYRINKFSLERMTVVVAKNYSVEN